jgi:hypothetical protein
MREERRNGHGCCPDILSTLRTTLRVTEALYFVHRQVFQKIRKKQRFGK